MRKDEHGDECPETLGEYRDVCHFLAPNSAAVELLDGRIAVAANGRNEKVIAPDLQMRELLYSLMV